jgi:uncharacterized repeat protein (TIGR01451 family)
MKTTTKASVLVLALWVAAMSAVLILSAQADASTDAIGKNRSAYDQPIGIHYPGRAPYMGRMAAPTPQVAPATKPAPTASSAPKTQPTPAATAQAKPDCSEATWGLIRLSKMMPAEATLGSEFLTELNIAAQSCAANVIVRETIPPGASYVRSEPAASVDGNQLVWRLGNLDAGETIKAKVWLKAEKEGALASCATVAADPRVCASTFVGKPVLSIVKSGPETALLGQGVTYQIVVKNTGSSVAKKVAVTDPVPTGMSHSSGKSELIIEVGDLAPGQSKPVAVTFKANQRGKICNTATASASNANKVSSDACTVVLVPGLKVQKSGPKEQIMMRNADYEILVTNTGDTPLRNVTVSDVAPTETTIVAAPSAVISGNRATWTIATLAAGAKVTQTIKLTSKVAGTHCNTVTASSSGVSDSAKACTLWKGIAAILLEVVDDPDPIQVGESTTYKIKVTNQGFADIHNAKIETSFSEQISPVSSAQGNTRGQNVTFPIVAILGAKQSVTYSITVKGTAVGDSRNKITLNAAELKTPVVEEESTTVY